MNIKQYLESPIGYDLPFQDTHTVLRGRYLSINAVTAITNLGIHHPIAKKAMRRAKFAARKQGWNIVPDLLERNLRRRLNRAWGKK